MTKHGYLFKYSKLQVETGRDKQPELCVILLDIEAHREQQTGVTPKQLNVVSQLEI